jgi:hypothetical protein
MIEEMEARIDNDFHRDLLKSRGEKLVKFEELVENPSDDQFYGLKQLFLTFEDTDQIDIENTYKVCISANNMELGVCDSFNNPVDIGDIIGKRLLDYGEIFFDTFITDKDSVLRVKLIFEEDYEINIDGYNLLIEKYSGK